MSATNRGKEREKNDFYPTPGWLTTAVLPHLQERLEASGVWTCPRVYEPAAGKMGIVTPLMNAWPQAQIEYSDIDPAFGYGSVDFLNEKPEPIFDLVITNPPYALAQEFIERSKLWLRTPDSMIALLLRVNFLGALKRAKWWREPGNMPSLYVSPKRPVMGLNKHGKPGTDATEYAWFVWPQKDPVLTILQTEDIEGR